jgi:hypothetical protein
LPALGLFSLLLAAGCGPRLSYNNQVEGTVKLDGAPLAGVLIQFVPDDNGSGKVPSSSGVTDDKGHYQLTYGQGKPGAVVGKHHVVVVQGRPGNAPENRDDQAGAAREIGSPLPMTYAIPSQTPLTQDVTPDQHTYDLNLSRGPRP